MTERVEQTINRWRRDAEVLRRYDLVPNAKLLESCADEIQRCFEANDEEWLSVKQAADESGYTEEHIRRSVRNGTLGADRRPGDKSHIRVQRKSLPRKVNGNAPANLSTSDYNPDEDARDIAQRLGGHHA